MRRKRRRIILIIHITRLLTWHIIQYAKLNNKFIPLLYSFI